MLGELVAAIRRRLAGPGAAFVRLEYPDGSARLLGPMSRMAAELLVAGVGVDAQYRGQRVASSRIVGGRP